MQNCILVTAIGTINGTAIIQELRKQDDVYLFGADIYPANYVVNSKDVDEFYQFPIVADDIENYVMYLLQFCKEHTINAIYAVIDEEVLALAQHREEFHDIGVVVCVPDLQTVEVCHNKAFFANWMEENMPEQNIRTYRNMKDIEAFPVFIKPIHGRASAGCRKVESMQELEELAINWNEYVVQEFVKGEWYAADIIANPKHNQLWVVQRKEHMRNSNGCGTVVEIVDDERIREICKQLAEKMHIIGVVNVEFFVNGDEIKIIEVNPRLPAGTAFTCMAGGNTVWNALHIVQGEPCEIQPLCIGDFYARRYETYKMK